jgi:CBS domain-containing protein
MEASMTLQARDIMTREVATVTASTSVHDIAELMTRKHISGVPVVDDGNNIIGIVTEADLLHRVETNTEKKSNWWLTLFSDSEALAREFSKAHGRTAGDIMTRKVVAVPENAPLDVIANAFDSHRIKRVPVTRDSVLVGIVSRGDIVRALLRLTESVPGKSEQSAGGDALRQLVLDKIRAQPWINGGTINVIVTDRAVELWGNTETEDQRRAIKILIEEMPGVSAIEDHLTVGIPRMGAI